MLQGLAMFDTEQRLIVCNRRYAEMYGLTPEQVSQARRLRQIFQYASPTASIIFGQRHRELRRELDPAALASSSAHPGAGGRPHHQRLAPADGEWRPGLVTHEDVTERQKLHARLEAAARPAQGSRRRSCALQNMQLDAALNNMVQGLAMFDAEHASVVCQRALCARSTACRPSR